MARTTLSRKWLPACILLMVMISGVPVLADTIIFQDPKAQQNGTVISEDDSAVTIRFPKTSIKSINKTSEKKQVPDADKVILEEKDGFHILRIPNNLIQVRSTAGQGKNPLMQQETMQSSPSEVKVHAQTSSSQPEEHMQSPPAEPQEQAPRIQNKLVEEEMGKVQGTILWRGMPLQGSVKIVLTEYKGFSFASLKKTLSSGSTIQSEENDIVLSTHTDNKGNYSFAKVPPGSYRLYWQPPGETEFIHRLRDKPDFEVVTGNMTTLNIPEK